ncbi:MAG: serine/threonine-protein kinase [Myxococcota bacterium]
MGEPPFHKELERGDLLDGAYRVERLIAQGGMGCVYEAEQVRLDRRVALKILSVDPKKSGEFLPRFRREAEICAKLSHPNIIAVLDWNVTHGMPYMVMELLDGEDLGFRLARGPMSVDEALPVINDIVAGLAAAHANGVVHRDLKPSNIFLCNVGAARPHVKLLDFGVSKVAWETTLSTTSPKVLGSPRYMAPEQARGDSNIDARVDQFALGAVIYEMLSGQFAFDGESLTAVLYRVVHEHPTPLGTLAPHLPPHVIATVERAMAKNAADRFQDVAQLLQALRGEIVPDAPHRPELKPPPALTLKSAGDTQLLAGELAKTSRVEPRLITGLALVAIALAVAVWRWAPHESGGESKPTTATKVDTVPPPTPPPVTQETKQLPRDAKVETPVKAPPPRESVEVKALLDQAQKHHDAGEFDEAIRRARQALGLQDAPRGDLIVALSYCGLSSLGDAKAALFSVRPEDKARVQKACRARGIDLD